MDHADPPTREPVELTVRVDPELLAEVGAPDDLSDFVNAALRAVRDLRKDPEAAARRLRESLDDTAGPAAPPPADLQAQMAEAAKQRAEDEAEEQAAISKWDQYLS